MIHLFLVLFGLCIGSFLSVCIYRIPYGRPKGPPDLSVEEEDAVIEPDQESSTPPEKLSVCSPARSFCTSCQRQLTILENIPVLSFLFQGGKCRCKKETISWMYPAVEILSALAAVGSYELYGATVTALLIYLLTATLIVISFIDLEYYIIPDLLSLPLICFGMAIGVVQQFFPLLEPPFTQGIFDTAVGVLVGGGTFYLVHYYYITVRKIDGLGFGDVKLLTFLGAFFGPQGALMTIFLGSVAGSIIGVGGFIFVRREFRKPIPFGPALALGTVAYLFSALYFGETVTFFKTH